MKDRNDMHAGRWLVLASSVTSMNGYGVLCRSLLGALRRTKKVDLDVFTADGASGWMGRGNLRSERIASRPRWWPLYALSDALLLLLRARGRYDGVVVLIEHYALAGWIFAKLRRIPLVLAQHGTYGVLLPSRHKAFRHVLHSADRVLPISRYTRDRMIQEGIRARFVVTSLGVDRGIFHPVPAKRERRVLFVGNFKARKGLTFLLEALSLACARVPGIRLTVVGRVDRNAPDFLKFAGEIKARGLDVEFAGALTDPELVQAYASSRLNALPSKSEPFFFEGLGLIHLEANACGTLTVGTLESGNEDAVGEGFGWLVRYGDVQGLADVIVKAMELEAYPVLEVERLRTWDDVARDYLVQFEACRSERAVSRRGGAPGGLP